MIFNSKIELRLEISNFMKINSTIHLYQQFYISIKNYFFILEYIYYTCQKSELKRKILEKILNSCEKILNEYSNKDTEYKTYIEENKDNDLIGKKILERETLLTKYSNIICEFIFPLIDKIQFYNDKIFREKFCNIFLNLIMCEKLPIRQKVKEILSNTFQNLNKNQEER